MASKNYYDVSRYNCFIQIHYILKTWFEEKQNIINPKSDCAIALKHIMYGCEPIHFMQDGKQEFPNSDVALCLIHALKLGKNSICEIDEKLWKKLEMKMHELEDLDSDESFIEMSDMYDKFFQLHIQKDDEDEEFEFVFHHNHHAFLTLEDDDLMEKYEHEDLSSGDTDDDEDSDDEDDEMEIDDVTK